MSASAYESSNEFMHPATFESGQLPRSPATGPGKLPVTDDVDLAWQRAVAVLQAEINRSADLIVLLDSIGTIAAVNQKWRQSARQLGMADAQAGLGTNYLSLCDAVRGPDAADARCVAAGLRDVLLRRTSRFEFHYPCLQSGATAWYTLGAWLVERAGARGVWVCHQRRDELI